MIKNLFWAIVFLVVAVQLTNDIYLLWAYEICLGKIDQTLLAGLFVIRLVINGLSRLSRITKEVDQK
ncbi:hypothetical protein [Lysinibacillus sp.]|uniref:hypothetical protein n=1 Tax=Lysinibacillus sp. TaxID=1869345 RepID=UPI00289C0BE6|nr:hypothetical protein [Lysinibacillus sp.]